MIDPQHGRILARRLKNSVDDVRVARSHTARRRHRQAAWRNGCTILAHLVGRLDDELGTALSYWLNAESNNYNDWISAAR